MSISEERFTLRELKILFGNSTPDKIRLAMTFAETHEERLRQVEAAIDWIAQEHAKTAHLRHKRDEDELTIDIVTDLKAMGFDASHDTQYGGHCDIVIEARDDFLWIAEAKIHKGYDWLLKGFQQLDTRYSTGLPGQNAGEMIIYCKGARTDTVMEKWKDHLGTARTDVTINLCERNKAHLRSEHVHQRTGATFKIRHVPISIHFNPKDK